MAACMCPKYDVPKARNNAEVMAGSFPMVQDVRVRRHPKDQLRSLVRQLVNRGKEEDVSRAAEQE